MNRALAVLTTGAFLTLVLGVVGAEDAVPALLLGALFAVLGTVGFGWVRRRGRLGWSVGYVAVQLALAFAVFGIDPSVGATLFLVVLVCQCVLLLPLPGTAVVIARTPFVHHARPRRCPTRCERWPRRPRRPGPDAALGVRGGAAAAGAQPGGAVPGRPGGPDQRAQTRPRHPRRPRAGLRDGAVGVEVCDDGTGAGGPSPGFGLVGLRERADQVGGRLHLESVQGQGTTLSMEVPG